MPKFVPSFLFEATSNHERILLEGIVAFLGSILVSLGIVSLGVGSLGTTTDTCKPGLLHLDFPILPHFYFLASTFFENSSFGEGGPHF